MIGSPLFHYSPDVFDAGAASLLSRSGTNWLAGPEIMAPECQREAHFGHAVVLDGDRFAVTAPYYAASPTGGVGGCFIYRLVPPDADGAGMPDDWESENGLSAVASNAPDANADGDWMTDWQEYVADTDPTNPLSVFPRVGAFEVAENRAILSVDPTSTARLYGAWANTNPVVSPASWSFRGSDGRGTGTAMPVDAGPLEGSSMFYRVGVYLP